MWHWMGITYLHRREFIVGTLEDMLAEIDSKILLNNVFDADCEIYLEQEAFILFQRGAKIGMARMIF